MASLTEKLRAFVQRFGYDIHRVGGRQLGRNHLADIRFLCGPGEVRTIFDVGANTGRSALLFHAEFPEAEIYSFEPFPGAFAELQVTSEKLPRVHPFHLGLGDAAETKTLHTSSGSELNSFLVSAAEAGRFLDPESLAPREVCEVPVTTLDAFRARHGIAEIDLLKIDTQGYELAVLRGAAAALRARAVKVIFLEVNFVSLYEQQCSFADLTHFLMPFGYRFVSFYEPAFSGEHYLKWTDAIFVRTASAMA